MSADVSPHVPTRPFVDRPVHDVAAASTLAARAALTWELPTPVLLRVGMNAMFAAGDAVIRVGEPSAPAGASVLLARRLAESGIRVAMPIRDHPITDGPMSATCWARIEPTGRRIDWREVGSMVRIVHALTVHDLPAGYPTPRPTDFPWWQFDRLLDDVGKALDPVARHGLEAAVARWPDWNNPEGEVVCHGDVHPGNVIMSADGPVLIDWDLLCLAPPGWDHAPMMTWAERWGGGADDYIQLAAGYGEDLRGVPSADAFAELRLVAATLMRVQAGLVDASAMSEAQRRLEFWRGESDAAVWQAQ